MSSGSTSVGVGSFEVPTFNSDSFDLSRFGLHTEIIDDQRYQRSVERFRERGIALPTFSQLANPSEISDSIRSDLKEVDRNAADPLNLYRVHWYNDFHGDFVDIPDHVVLTSEITGIDSPIIVAFGNRFPMIGAHKVLAAYSCLVPRVVTGQYDPTTHRAIWPSTGNYARGGVAISRLMGCRGVAVLPENMSRERFEWLDEWIANPEDVIKTTGSESNVKEIYDACNELEKDPGNFILNQFSEFSNHIGHHEVTSRALEHLYLNLAESHPGLNLSAFVAASGSAGTLAAGERLKSEYGARIVAVEALECPTMLYNGFGEHNIQGIGDKHIPLIHNVTNTDVVVGISDRACDELGVVFNSPEGLAYLTDLGINPSIISQLGHFGLSGICNVLAAIKTAKTLGFGADDAIVTVATDGAELYASEREAMAASRYVNGFSSEDASAAVEEHLQGVDTNDVEVLDEIGKNRIFNLGYYTWVEQQGIEFSDFEIRREQNVWEHLQTLAPAWDELIHEFNNQTGVLAGR
jgi:cysteine synthase